MIPTEPRWGLKSAITEALRNGSPVAWGARTIWKPGVTPDVVPDRQGIAVSEKHSHRAQKLSRAFATLLNGYRIDKAWKALELLSSVTVRSSDTVVLFDDHVLHVEANPMSSCGYLYVGAWIKPLSEEPYRWSGKGAVPKIGDKVYIPMVKSECTVLGLAVHHEYLGFAAEIHDMPGWLKEQKEDSNKDGFFFGVDIDYEYERKTA